MPVENFTGERLGILHSLILQTVMALQGFTRQQQGRVAPLYSISSPEHHWLLFTSGFQDDEN